jgi:four helix bundle protein
MPKLEVQSLSEKFTVSSINLTREFPSYISALRDQLVRASSSVALNVAEGSGRFGRDRVQHYRIAYGSARESLAILNIISGLAVCDQTAVTELITSCDRICGMIWGLIKYNSEKLTKTR